VSQEIPEDGEVHNETMCIRPHEGVASNKVSPVIRPPGKPTVLMMPLDLAANDYLKRPGTSQ